MFRNALRFALSALILAGVFQPGDAFSGENLLVGKRLFNSYCALCHGEDGKGQGVLSKKLKTKNPIADLTADKYQSKSVEDLLRLIQGYNRDATMMPKWEQVIPERNLRHVAAYVLALTQTDLRMRGDARRGREIFRQSCVACHGPRGEGNGVLAQILDAKMINYRTKKLAEVTDEQLITIITNGKGEFMPPWMGTLSNEEIKDVAAYVRGLYQGGE